VMREGCKGSVASEERSGGAGERRCGGFPTGVGRRGEGGEFDRWGLVDKETRERRPARENTNRKENVFPAKTQPTRGLDGPTGTILACGDGTAGGLAGPEAKRAAGSAGPKIRKKEISELKLDF
jgi:hypothetical protein